MFVFTLESLVISLITFVVVYFVYYIILKRRLRDEKKFMNSTEILYLKIKYKINVEKTPKIKLVKLISLGNAFTISFVFLLMSFINLGLIRLFIAIIFLVPTIIAVYFMIGNHLRKGGY